MLDKEQSRACAVDNEPHPYPRGCGKMEFVTAVKALARAKQSDLDRVTQVQLERWGLQKVQLRQHQLEGVTWLAERCDRSHGCILGDEMGLGKTLQVR